MVVAAGESCAAPTVIGVGTQLAQTTVGFANDLSSATSGAIDDALIAHGMMSPEDERALFVKSVHEVLAPGFEALGLAVGDIRSKFDDAWATTAAA